VSRGADLPEVRLHASPVPPPRRARAVFGPRRRDFPQTASTVSTATEETTTTVSLSTISERGLDALDAAHAAIAAARQVTIDISASGLTLDVPSTVVDTATLNSYIGQLETLSVTPPILIPSLTDDTTAEVQSVKERTAALRGQLDAAIAQKKAEEEAAAKAAAEAAAAAAAAEAAAQAAAAKAAEEAAAAKQAAASVASTPAVDVNVDPASAQGIARSMMAASYGWGDDQFACLVALWNKESGWRVNAANPSGAYGIPQALPGSKMASAGADWQTNPATQIAWGLGYIAGRYGNACGAWSHSQSVGWY
jgi:hypothetical protein